MILFLLKLIGIILLCILGLLLLVVLLVLFAPVRYYAQIEYEKDNLRLNARITWLAIFRFYLRFLEKKLSYRFLALFIPIINSERPKKEKKIKAAKKAQVSVETEQKQPEIVPNEPEIKSEAAPKEVDVVLNETDAPVEVNETIPEEPKKTKKSFFKWKLHFLHPAELYDIIVTKILNIWDAISKKIKKVFKSLDKLCEMILAEENHDMIREILGQVEALFRHIRPRKHGIYLKAGFKDPALTGQVLGAYSVINNILALNFVLEPDFDREILEVKAYMKGRIRVINLLVIVIRVYRNKTLRKLIRRK